MPVGSPAGQLTLRRVSAGNGSWATCCTSSAANAADAEKSNSRPHRKSISRAADCCEIAIAGIPSTIPSSAAATVPE